MKINPIEINHQFKKALDLLEKTSQNLFVTGKAGTGKSTLLNYFRTNTRKKVAVLAPTGVAALNVRGETIHSFFRFRPDITVKKIVERGAKIRKGAIYKKLDAILIDEVSMVRADLLDCVDWFMRLSKKRTDLPFGGTQMIFIGDLYQLPPVVTGKEKEIFETHYASPYFFDAMVFQQARLELVELEKIYRQKDESFIRLLNGIRNNSITEEGLARLNERVGAVFPSENCIGYAIHLTTTNAMAQDINREHLMRLENEFRVYPAQVSGDFDERSFPTDQELYLAAGAQVMFLNNDSRGRWVNGSLGKVIEIRINKNSQGDVIVVQLENGQSEEVLPYAWELFHFKFNETLQAIETETTGIFTQYPLKLAWAVTIHKSQGKTFDRIVIDMGKGSFASGQTYVALSRCTSLKGISLKIPLKKSHILMDERIVRFMTPYDGQSDGYQDMSD